MINSSTKVYFLLEKCQVNKHQQHNKCREMNSWAVIETVTMNLLTKWHSWESYKFIYNTKQTSCMLFNELFCFLSERENVTNWLVYILQMGGSIFLAIDKRFCNHLLMQTHSVIGFIMGCFEGDQSDVVLMKTAILKHLCRGSFGYLQESVSRVTYLSVVLQGHICAG